MLVFFSYTKYGRRLYAVGSNETSSRTPFYAEAGGQVADAGVLRGPGGEHRVLDVQRPIPGLVVHTVELGGELAVGDPVEAIVDAQARRGDQ